MLTRAEFCHLTSMDPERLKSLGRRDQLPFYYADNSVADVESRHGRRNYHPIDALRMIVQDDFSRQGGIPMDDAVKVATNAFGLGLGARLDPADRTQDVWIGVARHDFNCDGKVMSGAVHVGGTLLQVMDRVAALEEDAENFRIVLVNLSGAYRTLRKRARSLPTDLQERIIAEIEGASA